MSYFIFDGIIQEDRPFLIEGEEAGHLLKSRRVSVGDFVQCQDSSYKRYLAAVEKLEKDKLVLFPIKRQPVPPEPEFKINLFQAFIKEKALDIIIQKTTELGVSGIYFFPGRFSQNIRPKANIAQKKLRWNKIAAEACKQSGRIKPPEVDYLSGSEEVQRHLSEDLKKKVSGVCLATCGKTVNLKDLSLSTGEVNVVIGPEGGWAEREAESFGIPMIHLGPRILRAETAAVSMVGILQYLFGDLDFKPSRRKQATV